MEMTEFIWVFFLCMGYVSISNAEISPPCRNYTSLGEKSGLQISLLTTWLQSDDPILSGSLAASNSCLQRWKTSARRKKSMPFYTTFKLVLRSLEKKDVRSCVSRNPFSPLPAEASFEPPSSLSFVKVQVKMLLHKSAGNREICHYACLGRRARELPKGCRYSGWGRLANLWTSSCDEPNNFSS